MDKVDGQWMKNEWKLVSIDYRWMVSGRSGWWMIGVNH